MTGEGRDLLLVIRNIRIKLDEEPSNQQPEEPQGSKEGTFDPAQESDKASLREKRVLLRYIQLGPLMQGQQPEEPHGRRKGLLTILAEKRNILRANRWNPTQPERSSTYGRRG